MHDDLMVVFMPSHPFGPRCDGRAFRLGNSRPRSFKDIVERIASLGLHKQSLFVIDVSWRLRTSLIQRASESEMKVHVQGPKGQKSE